MGRLGPFNDGHDYLTRWACAPGRVSACGSISSRVSPVRSYDEALAWYERLIGTEPSFLPHATEAVWELAEHRFLFIVERPEHAGHAIHTIFVGDLGVKSAEIASRGIEAARWETYPNGVRKATHRDPDGNEIGLGGTSLTP